MKSKELDQWLIEMRKADGRLRKFPNGNGQSDTSKPRKAALRWALRLTATNLDDLSEGDVANLQREVACFSRFEMKDVPWLPSNLISPVPWPSRKQIGKTQRWLRNILKAIIGKQAIEFIDPAHHWGITYDEHEQSWVHGMYYKTVIGPGVQPLFHLIREHLNDLRACQTKDCRRLFLQDRRNQTFCSTPCQWRDNQRRFLHISPDRYGRRGRLAGTTTSKKSRAKKQHGSDPLDPLIKKIDGVLHPRRTSPRLPHLIRRRTDGQ